MNDGRLVLAQQYPGLRFLDMAAPVKVLAASNEGGQIVPRGEDGRLRIRSLVSTPRVNSYGFRIDPSAWLDAIPGFRENPVMLAYHDMSHPIGRWDIAQTVTPEGLVLEGWISASEPGIQEKVLDGTISRASVSFWTLAQEKDDDDMDVVTKARLFEVSLVPIPADAGTMVEPLSAPEPEAAAAAAVPGKVVPLRRAEDEALVAEFADACRAALGAMDTLGRVSRIAAGLRRETIRRGGE